jgi:tetratricopeptide (TPR) repeat protein
MSGSSAASAAAPPSLLDSLEVPSLTERPMRKVSRSLGAESTLFEEVETPGTHTSTAYSDWDDDEEKDKIIDNANNVNVDSKENQVSDEKPSHVNSTSAAAAPVVVVDGNANVSNAEEDETEEEVARRVQQKKIEALLRRQRAAADYVQQKLPPATAATTVNAVKSSVSVVIDQPPSTPSTPSVVANPVPVVVTPVALPTTPATPVTPTLTPQEQRAKSLALRNARLASPFMSGPAQVVVVTQTQPPAAAAVAVATPPPSTPPPSSLPRDSSVSSLDDWRRDSDRFLASLRGTDSTAQSSAGATGGGGYVAYENPDLAASSVSRQTYGYEADSSVSYSMPDIATLSASVVTDNTDDSDAYDQPATAQYRTPDCSAATAAVAAASPAAAAPLPVRASAAVSAQSVASPALSAGGMRPLVRAWNEEFQRLWVRHLEANNRLRSSRSAVDAGADRLDEELNVLLSIGQLVSDFTNAAMRIGRVIISEAFQPAERKSIKPVAVGGVGGGLKFVAEGMFFKFAVDEYDLYGGNEYAAKAANHEFRHLQLLMAHAISGARGPCLHFPLMTLITFRGFRLIATTVLPIDASTIVYGSANAAVSVHSAADVAPVMRDIAAEFNLAPHHVVSRDLRQRLQLHACADIEVHRGRDQRLYIIDCHRLMPPTMPPAVASPDAPDKLIPLRKNANLYYLFRAMFVRAHSVPLSSDAFSGFSDRVEGREHNRVCRDATVHLLEHVVPRVAHALEARVARLGGKIGSLRRVVEYLHRNGVNMRFLGYVRNAVTEASLRCALLTEMMARTIKQLLNTGLRKLQTVLLQDYCDYIYRLFNESIFGGRKLRTVAWWRQDGPAALLQRFARAYDRTSDGDDLRQLIDERLLYDRLREITGVDFGAYEAFCGFMTGGVQHSAYTILELEPVVHRLYVLPIFEATLLQQESTPPADASFETHTAFFEKVRQLYIEGLTTRPEDVTALDALAVAFKQHAVLAGKHVRGALALELFAEAFECFRDALEISPKSHLAVLHFDYGVTIAAKARAVIDARRARLDDGVNHQVLTEMLADDATDAKKRAHAEALLRKLQVRMTAADADPLHFIDDMELAALYTKAAQQFEVAARLDDRDFDALYNRAHCVLMAEIVMVVHGDSVAPSADDNAAEREREAKAERFRNSSGAGTLSVSTLAVPPRKMSASLDVDPTCDAAQLGELRRKAAIDACELAQTLCEQAVQLEIAASGVDPVGDELPPRAVALERLKNALEQDAASALRISGRRSPRSERRRERLQSLSPSAQPPVVRSWPPRREEVERDEPKPVQLPSAGSDDERSDEAAHPSERGFGLGTRVNVSQ